jgi:ADP-ribosylglycohydrolase
VSVWVSVPMIAPLATTCRCRARSGLSEALNRLFPTSAHPGESVGCPGTETPCPPPLIASGCLLGLAVGDALGTTLEFTRPGGFEPITDMLGGGPFGLQAGEWTDDTSMALCLAESLVLHGFDPKDQIERYIRWWKEGHMSSTGRCFDIGNTVRPALQRFERTGEPFSGWDDPYSAGNGYVVRCLEAALWAFHCSRSFRDECLLAVNLGDDVDTTAAVYGQLAGAWYGASRIPEERRGQVAMLEEIRGLAGKLGRGGSAEE